MSWGRRLPKNHLGRSSVANNSLDCWPWKPFTLSIRPQHFRSHKAGDCQDVPGDRIAGVGLASKCLAAYGPRFSLFTVNCYAVEKEVSPIAMGDEGSALRPAIFREKLSKAFILLVRGSTKERPFRWDVSITQEHSFRRNASPTSAPADPGRPVPPAGTPPPADRRKYFPAHAVPVLRPLPPPYRAARWSRAPSPFGSPSFSAPFS